MKLNNGIFSLLKSFVTLNYVMIKHKMFILLNNWRQISLKIGINKILKKTVKPNVSYILLIKVDFIHFIRHKSDQL